MFRKYFSAILFIIAVGLSAQEKADDLYDPYTPEYFTGKDPAWLQEIVKNPRGVNFFEMEKKFSEWLQKDPDAKKKTPNKKPAVNFYRRWKKAYQPFVNAKGEIVLPTMKEHLRQIDNANRASQLTMLSRRRVKRELADDKPLPEWRNIGPNTTAKNDQYTGFEEPYDSHANVYRLDISKSNHKVLYAGAETGAVFKTTDQGLNWSACDATYDFGQHIFAIKIDPNNENTVFVGSDTGLFLTENGGQTFKRLNGISERVNSIRISPDNSNIVTVTTEKGFYVSYNKGASFSLTFNGICEDHELKPKSSNIVYLLGKKRGDTSFKFYTSYNNGINFNDGVDILPNVRMGRLAVSDAPNGENYVYALVNIYNYDYSHGQPHIVQSKDSGQTWTDKTTITSNKYDWSNTFCPSIDGSNGGQGYYDMMLGVSGTNPEHVIFGLCSAYRSLNGGAGGYKENAIGGYCSGNLKMHADMQDIAVLGDEVWIANDGGIRYSPNFFQFENGKYTTMNRVNGIYAADYYGFGQGWNEDVIAGGRWHNGDAVMVASYGKGKAVYVGGVEQATGYVMVSNPKEVYFTDAGMFTMPNELNGKIQAHYTKFYTQPYEYLRSHGFLATDPRYAQRILLHPKQGGPYGFGSTNQIWETDDEGSNFHMIYDTEGQPFSNIEFARSNPDVLYACGIYDIFKSTDNGKTWKALEHRIPESVGFHYYTYNPTSYLQIDPRDENTLWVVKANEDGAVAYTHDGGKTWTNPLNEEMKKIQFRFVVLAGDEAHGVYLATENGAKVYYKDDNLPDWIDYSKGLPPAVRLTRILPFFKDGKLRAATSQGIWEVPLYHEYFKPVAQPMIVDLSGPSLSGGVSSRSNRTLGNSVSFNADTPVQFDSYSIVNQNGVKWEWSFSPEPYYVSDKNARNPRVVFKYNGNYNVTLKVTSRYKQPNGQTVEKSDSKTIKNMVVITNSIPHPATPEPPATPEKKICMKLPYTSGIQLPTKIIISTINPNGADFEKYKNAFIKMESNDKPFVITRLSTEQRNNIQDPVEGMLIWNTTLECLDLYKNNKWSCITQGCNE